MVEVLAKPGEEVSEFDTQYPDKLHGRHIGLYVTLASEAEIGHPEANWLVQLPT